VLPWTAHGHRVGQRLAIHIGNLEGTTAAPGNPAPDVNGIPPTNGQTDGTTQPDN